VTADELRTSLDASRAALLAAIEGLTDRDFAAEISSGETIIGLLSALAVDEREAIRLARQAVGAEPRPLPTTGGPRLSRAIPPQVVHNLAGARHETLLFIDTHGDSLMRDGAGGEATLHPLLTTVVERERAAAERIAAHRASA
jgi:hypothetical protein